ncbi:P-loop containing nucleoside triphosphate hydrolase protein [Fusarium oxysporum f. sp. albedinis]|nr:P-loop containing nucleoside triphosphate hydrolase protein [Fusarium oxysporum f. sp. albedinis]
MNTPSEMQFGTKKLQRGPGRIEFVNVSFDHIRGGEVIPVFKDLSLAIEAGSTTAFVGESGIGKSTLLKLLTREANPKSGSITIDGQDIQALKQYDILENIRLGNPLASLEQVQVAARSAAIFEEINSMPNQFDTQVEHNGRRFSGGQRQRLALARAFLSSGSLIYCWDEHTRSLDTTTENHVRKNIGSLCDNKTSIVTTHRLSTIVDAAMIYHLGNEGPYTIVMEMGTHTELLEKGGVYAKMWNNSSNSPLQAAPV